MKPAFLKLFWGSDGVTAEGDSSYYHGNAIEQADGTRNGVYSGVVLGWYDSARRHLPLWNVPTLYYLGPQELYISNSIPKLIALGVPSDWDDDAMAVFIRRQTFVGEDTPFKCIRSAPPGAKLTWTNGKMTLEGQHFAPKPQHLKRSAIIDGVIDLFSQSITRRLPQTDDFYLPLTGGKDSRHILLELARQSALPKACVTASFPPPLINQDKEIARQLTDRLGIPHIVLPPVAPGISDEQRKNLVTNFCCLDHGWTLPLVDFLEANTSLSYDGLGLDVFFNTMWYSDHRAKLYEQGAFEALAIDLLRDSETAFSIILTPEANRRFSRARAIARLVKELKLHADRPHPVASFQFWSRTRRVTSSLAFSLQSEIPTVHTPFLDHDLFDFVYSSHLGSETSIHFDALSTAYPDFNDVTFVTSGTLNRSRSRQTRKALLKLVPFLLPTLLKRSWIKTPQISARLLKVIFTGKDSDLYWLQPLLINHIAQLEKHILSEGQPICT